jgi:hypothetical protein
MNLTRSREERGEGRILGKSAPSRALRLRVSNPGQESSAEFDSSIGIETAREIFDNDFDFERVEKCCLARS